MLCDIMELLIVYCTLTFLRLTQNWAHGHTADSAKEICHYDIIKGKSPLISNSSEDTWYTYKPSLLEVSGYSPQISDADDTAIYSEMCDQQCCEDPECNMVVVRSIDSPDNSSYCVIFQCGEAGCQLQTNDRYDVHIKVKEVDSNHDTSIVEDQVSSKTVAPKNGEENGRTTTAQLDEVISKHSSMEQGGTTPKYNELLNNSLITPADSKIGGINGKHSENSTNASNFTALSLVEDIPSVMGQPIQTKQIKQLYRLPQRTCLMLLLFSTQTIMKRTNTMIPLNMKRLLNPPSLLPLPRYKAPLQDCKLVLILCRSWHRI